MGLFGCGQWDEGILCDGKFDFDEMSDTGGFQIVDVRDGFNPVKVGIYTMANYTHDIQCVNYHGPDTAFVDHEICFVFTPDVNAVTILDVTNKSDIIELSHTEALNETHYVHQGWVTSSHEFLLMDDELDEYYGEVETQMTYIFDVRNLSAPTLLNRFDSNLTVIDHNQYIIDNGKSTESGEFRGYSFQSNYEAGLRVLNIDGIAEGDIFEVAYFDSYVWAQLNLGPAQLVDGYLNNVSNFELIEAERHDSVNFRGMISKCVDVECVATHSVFVCVAISIRRVECVPVFQAQSERVSVQRYRGAAEYQYGIDGAETQLWTQ